MGKKRAYHCLEFKSWSGLFKSGVNNESTNAIAEIRWKYALKDSRVTYFRPEKTFVPFGISTA